MCIRFWLLLSIGLLLAALAFCQAETTVTENVVYAVVQGSELHLDIYQPTGAGATASAAVLLIHGGGWNSLDKSTMRRMGEFLARSGFVAFAVDYRLFQGTQNRWPSIMSALKRWAHSGTPPARNSRRCWEWKTRGTTPMRRWPSIRAECRP